MTVFLVASFGVYFFLLFIALPFARRRQQWHLDRMKEITGGLVE
jgi:hypothetical protein